MGDFSQLHPLKGNNENIRGISYVLAQHSLPHLRALLTRSLARSLNCFRTYWIAWNLISHIHYSSCSELSSAFSKIYLYSLCKLTLFKTTEPCKRPLAGSLARLLLRLVRLLRTARFACTLCCADMINWSIGNSYWARGEKCEIWCLILGFCWTIVHWLNFGAEANNDLSLLWCRPSGGQ